MNVLVFGATGNLGKQVINVIKKLNYKLVGISYYKNVNGCKEINSQYFYSPINVSNVNSYQELIDKTKPDVAINCIRGYDGLEATLLIIKNKINLILSNKESLVVAGEFVFDLAKKHKVSITPLDSEPTGLMHILKNNPNNGEIKKLYIGASGGSFYGKNKNYLKTVNKNDVLKHPSWNMSLQMSIDSSTLINKFYEIIECYWYFKKKVKVFYQDKSSIHACVLYKNKKLVCSEFESTMQIPSEIVLTNFKINKYLTTYKKIKLKKLKHTHSLPIKWASYYLKHPRSSFPIVINVANEFFAEQFILDKIRFVDIIYFIKQTVKKNDIKTVNSLEEVYLCKKNTLDICKNLILAKH